MIMALFMFGSIGFWLLCGAAMLMLLLLVEFERSWLAFATLAVTAMLLCIANGAVLPMLMANPLLAVAGVGAYAMLGAIWSLVKWVLLVKDRKEKFLEEKVKRTNSAKLHFEKRVGREPDEKELNIEVVDYIHKHAGSRKDFGMPIPSHNKTRIMHWMAYWPWSVVNSIVFDFVRRGFKHIYNLLADVYRKIAENIYKDIRDESGDETEW